MEGQYSIEAVGPRIRSFLDDLIRNAGFKLKFDIAEGSDTFSDFETPDVIVRFSGPDVELLLENKAELLLALEQVVAEVLNVPSEHHSRVCFDAHDYRVLRIEELRLSAAAAADKVKRTGVPFRFSPMTSRERRILHLALRDETSVRSESAGIGPHRQVVIYPAGMPSSADPGPQTAPLRPGARGMRRRR
jgi:spoIIIJ-associated protein